jgi:hypothetical protein
MARAEAGHDEGGQRQDSGRKKPPQHSSPCIPESSSDVLARGHWATSTSGTIDAAKLCWQHRCPEHGGWPMAQGGAATLIRG